MPSLLIKGNELQDGTGALDDKVRRCAKGGDLSKIRMGGRFEAPHEKIGNSRATELSGR